jgi:hypothetical protein
MAALAGLLVTGAGYWLFNRRVKAVLSEALGGEQQALRAMQIAGKGRRNQLAQSGPGPGRHGRAGRQLRLAHARARPCSATAGSHGLGGGGAHAPAAVPPDASCAKAVKLYENGDKVQALAMLENGRQGGRCRRVWPVWLDAADGRRPGGPTPAPTARQREARQVAAS